MAVRGNVVDVRFDASLPPLRQGRMLNVFREPTVKQSMRDKRIEHREFIVRHGDDMPEVRDVAAPSS